MIFSLSFFCPDGVLDREDIANLTRIYVNWLIEAVREAGIPTELIVNHVGGQQPDDTAQPVIPYSAGFSREGVPGYSFYWGTPMIEKIS